MGETELALILKYGIPLAVKMLHEGRDEEETVKVVKTAITGLKAGDVDIGGALLNANEEQSKSIIDGLFGIITGVGDAFGGLIKAFFGIFG